MPRSQKKPTLLYLVLCEQFTQDASGKRSLMGTFDRISSSSFPFVFPHFSIVTGWEGIEGDYVVRVKVEAPDSKSVFASPLFGLQFRKPLYRSDLVVEVQGLKFEVPGVYSVMVLQGEKEKPLAAHPLLVERIPDTQPQEVQR